jgi:hypothetical protein
MLSDSIFDLLYCPSSGTERDNVRWFLEDLEHYRKEPFDYEPEHLEVLRRLAQKYLEKPSFVSFQNLHRSAVAMMRFQDCSSAALAVLEVKDGELCLWPYGKFEESASSPVPAYKEMTDTERNEAAKKLLARLKEKV